MYNVALVQNESEMMRYSWADIRPMVERLQYSYDGYTAENINELFPRLSGNRYDAIVIASNACNDQIVLEALESNQQAIEEFLISGKGLFVSFQMKMATLENYGFLPEDLRVSAKNRIDRGENPKEGDLILNPTHNEHTIALYPEKLNLEKVKSRSLTNNLVEGLYWIFLEAENPEYFDTLISDESYSSIRELLICSREDLPYRLVVSALALDWQQQHELWENSVRFVVEGKPTLAVVEKQKQQNFDFQYLLSTFEVNKISYAKYSRIDLSPQKNPLVLHNAFLLDPAWSDEEIDIFLASVSDLVNKGNLTVLFYDRRGHNRLSLGAVSNAREYQAIAKNAISWLVSQFPEDPEEGFWAKSFFSTVDVINTFIDFDEPLDHFQTRILDALYRKDRSGSYDKVLGATCAMLEIYYEFLGRNHERSERTLKWIQNKIPEKTLFEKATAYSVLNRLQVKLPESEIEAFRNEIVNVRGKSQNEFLLHRFGKTLLGLGFIKEARGLALDLCNLQEPIVGKWVSLPHSAAVVEFLIDLQSQLKNHDERIDSSIFRGIQFIKSNYSRKNTSWKSHVSATAKCLSALKAFEEKVSYPNDLVRRIIASEDRRRKSYSAIEAASKTNINLQKQLISYGEKNQSISAELADSKKKLGAQTKFTAILVSILGSLSIALFYIFADLTERELIANVFDYLELFASTKLFIVLAPPGAVLVLLLLASSLSRLGASSRIGRLGRLLSSFFSIEAENPES